MFRSRGEPSRIPAAGRLLAALALCLGTLAGAGAATASDQLQMEASAFLGGHVRTGAWAAVRVDISNDGPDFSGELRIRSNQQGRSVYAVEAELPSGARKQFVLHAQPPIFASKLVVELVDGDTAVSTRDVAIRSRDVSVPMVGLIAERPEAVQRDLEDALRNHNMNTPVVALLRPEDLPPRVEAWAAMDRLVWQDVDTARLSADQINALQLWVSAGGQLTIIGGTTGPDSLRALPPELLPFVPDRTVDVQPAELTDLLGSLPDGAATLPALAGTLSQGAVLGRSGDFVYAARTALGQGSVSIVGVDPGTAWLARSEGAASLWRRVLPQAHGQLSPFHLPDESSIFFNALYNLPAVALPPIEQLFVLLLAYIALIGPVNYLVLRRLDRREWAWLTMPLLVAVFAVGSYGLGAALKGSDVIINEVAIVRAGPDSTRGLGQVYVGVYSPSRRTFDLRVPGGALLAGPTSANPLGQGEQPINALLGDTTSRLREFEVGFGVIRGFRADAAVDAPAVRADLRLVRGEVVGTVTNSSETALEHVAVVFAGGVATLPEIPAGETREVSIRRSSNNFYSMSERIFGTSFSRDPVVQRRIEARRAVVDQVTGHGPTVLGASPDLPLLLAWREGIPLEVEIAGERPTHVGDSLFVVPLSMAYDREAVFDDQLLLRTIVDQGSEQGWGETNSYSMDRGTMTLELRPAGLSQKFNVGSLELAMSQGGFLNLRGRGDVVSPLPDGEQPSQDDPLGAEPEGKGGGVGEQGGVGQDDLLEPEPWPMGGLPAVQVLDHARGLWFELPEFVDGRSYVLADPARWVDEGGRLVLRLVNRGQRGQVHWFQLAARMEGIIE
ncbi:MAG TPA: hypothetical protein VM305_07985 [Candidatus Limnocylindrales bacterium]|nr:hypothetical protein [Candidatus Limnocylindrales bacterium]